MNKIEMLREKLHRLIAKGLSLNSGEVLKISQELDKIINEYSDKSIAA